MLVKLIQLFLSHKFMKEEHEKVVVDFSNKSDHVHFKSRKHILTDNFLGGMAWGLGSVIGATIIVGLLGVAIVRTKSIPLIGDIVKVFVTEIQGGIKEFTKAQ